MLNFLARVQARQHLHGIASQALRQRFSHVSQLANSAEEFLEKTRNIAIIAHVDHGKTTLVDSLLRYGGVNFEQECALDSNQLEREKGITILSKCTNILYNSYNINIVDTPGHHDFGGEVERVLGMVDGVCLVICATEGPMTQSKFVLRKALEQKLSPMVIINKVDRPTARSKEVMNEVFELFCDLHCPDHLLDYPTFFASGKNGWAVENMNDEKKDIECILKGIIKHVPPPKVNENKKFSMLVTQTHPNAYFGKMMLGRINSG